MGGVGMCRGSSAAAAATDSMRGSTRTMQQGAVLSCCGIKVGRAGVSAWWCSMRVYASSSVPSLADGCGIGHQIGAAQQVVAMVGQAVDIIGEGTAWAVFDHALVVSHACLCWR